MKHPTVQIGVWLLGLVGLQQSLAWLGQHGPLADELRLLKQRDLEPAAYFYTDSPETRRAVQAVEALDQARGGDEVPEAAP